MITEEKSKIRRFRVKQRITAEVDVNQLAEAIVLAEDLRRQRDEVNLKNAGDRPSNVWMKMIISVVFWGIAIFTGLTALGCFVYGGFTVYFTVSSSFGIDWTDLATGVMLLCIGFLLVVITLITALTAKEIDQETDRHYVASMFSNVVATSSTSGVDCGTDKGVK